MKKKYVLHAWAHAHAADANIANAYAADMHMNNAHAADAADAHATNVGINMHACRECIAASCAE